jgi:hypothetical protein
VLISAPSDDVDVTLVPGVNDDMYQSDQHHVLSMASCAAPRPARSRGLLRFGGGLGGSGGVRTVAGGWLLFRHGDSLSTAHSPVPPGACLR